VVTVAVTMVPVASETAGVKVSAHVNSVSIFW